MSEEKQKNKKEAPEQVVESVIPDDFDLMEMDNRPEVKPEPAEVMEPIEEMKKSEIPDYLLDEFDDEEKVAMMKTDIVEYGNELQTLVINKRKDRYYAFAPMKGARGEDGTAKYKGWGYEFVKWHDDKNAVRVPMSRNVGGKIIVNGELVLMHIPMWLARKRQLANVSKDRRARQIAKHELEAGLNDVAKEAYQEHGVETNPIFEESDY